MSNYISENKNKNRTINFNMQADLSKAKQSYGQSNTARIVQLQKAAGNQAILRMFNASGKNGNYSNDSAAFQKLRTRFEKPVQKKDNKTGLPDNLKNAMEKVSGFNMDDVRVHYNSLEPRKFGALAYTQDTDIHVAPGQEKHLPHESWHVIQQAQKRVKPTTQLAGMPVNNNLALEKEADVKGATLTRLYYSGSDESEGRTQRNINPSGHGTVQCMLEIEDTDAISPKKDKAPDNKKIFKSSAEARAYLMLKIAKSPIKESLFATPQAIKRLNDMLTAADDVRYVYPVTLAQVFDYIANAVHIGCVPFDITPEITPPRTTSDTALWSYTRYSDKAPDHYDVPQSPIHTMFPYEEEARPTVTLPVASEIALQKERIASFKKGAKGLGKNQFAYDVVLKYRLDKLIEVYAHGLHMFGLDRKHSLTFSHRKLSPFYTSKKIMPAQGKNKKRNMELAMISKLEYLRRKYDRSPFNKSALFFTYNKETRKRIKRPLGDILKRNAKSLGSLFFHSEIQAVSDEAGAKDVGKKAVIDALSDAYGKVPVSRDIPYNLIFLCASINGYSDPNKVCDGACKSALAELGKIITESIKAEIKIQESNYSIKGLIVRAGSDFTELSSVSSKPGNRFNPKGSGGNVSNSAPTLTHRLVSEFPG